MTDSFLPCLPAWTGCLLIARFPVQAELRRRPELAGRPLAVTAAGSRSARVLAASLAATGVRSDQPVSEAFSRCAGLLLLPEDRLYLEQAQAGLQRELRRVVDRVESAAPGLFYLNLSGMTGLYGGLEGLATAVLGAAEGDWRPRLGVSAGGKFPARLAAVRAELGGWRLAPAEPAVLAAWLAVFPVSALPLAAAELARLRELGLNTLGAVARLPAERLADFLGPAGLRVKQLANGCDPDPVRPAAEPERLAERMVFPWPLSDAAGLLAAVRSLCETLGSRGGLEGRMAGQALLSGDLLEGGRWRWARRLRFPAGSASALYAALQSGLSARDVQGRSPLPAGELIDLTLVVSDLSPQHGFQAGLEQAVGESRIRSVAVPGVERLTPLDPDSLLPERRWMLGRGRKPLAQPAAAVVDCREGRPWRVGYGLRREGRLVAAVADCWELETDWWQPEPVARRYWALALADGGLVTVFQDRLSGSWFRQG